MYVTLALLLVVLSVGLLPGWPHYPIAGFGLLVTVVVLIHAWW